MTEAITILINLLINNKLKQNKFCFFKKINNKIELNQEDIVVAIGIIINPTVLKQKILTKIFNKTEVKEIQNGIFVLCRAKKKLEKTFINENAGRPKLK